MAQRDGLTDLAAVANGQKLPPVAMSNQRLLQQSRCLDGSEGPADSPEDLVQRDLHSVQYVKSLLDQGDTFVFVKFPNNEPVYDTTGFELRTKHTVHSEKLIESGSTYFIETLQSREQQLKLQRRFGLVGRLPKGIKYLLDLSPPEEGDDALLLTARLCCSLGVRKWYKSEKRCCVSKDLVGGRDEVQHLSDLESRGDPLEYCPIRHRTGIERLLQAIEGKDPRLDSAPKVWTLVVLAHHFGCAKLVEDHVLSWLLAEPNTRFIEILPEATLRMGIMLENEFLTKFAFSILVSEEALRLGSGNFFRDYELKSAVALMAAKNKKNTRLGRPIEDIVDEDWTNMIQYAGQAFAGRIHQQVTDLLHPDVKWIIELPEYRKLLDARQFLREGAELRNHLAAHVCFLKHLESLHEGIRDFVRGRLLRCLRADLAPNVMERMHSDRKVENYLSDPDWHISEIYNSLNDQERVLARPFWDNVGSLDWTMRPHDNEIFEWAPINSRQDLRNRVDGESYKVRYVETGQIERVAKTVNLAIFHMTKDMGYHGGVLPAEADGSFLFNMPSHFHVEDPSMTDQDIDPTGATSSWASYDIEDAPPTVTMSRLTISNPSEKTHEDLMFAMQDIHDEPDYTLPFPRDRDVTEDEVLVHYDYCVNNGLFPRDDEIGNDSIFFNLTRLFTQVRDHLGIICTRNLARGENDQFVFSFLCDTLLSLSDKEYAFLPLWAGGMNDGSGGVFAGAVPFAERGAPSQPGPSYHTGSTLASAASSELGFDGERYSLLGGDSASDSFSFVHETSDAGDTSMGVEDGEDDHLDRGTVVSEKDFASSEGFSDIGGEEVEPTVPATPIARAQVVVPLFVEDDNFFNAPDDEDDAMRVDDDGDETETEN